MADSSNRTCPLCQGHEATHFCNCLNPSTLFCIECFPRHYAKFPRNIHHTIPIVALNHNPEEYLRKSQTLEKGIAELRKNLEKIDEVSHAFEDLIEKCVNYLIEYRSWWLQCLQTEKTELATAIEAAVRKATDCLDQGIEPVGGLEQALWTLPPEQLQVFTCTITAPDMQTLCQTWASYENTLVTLCERFSKEQGSKGEELKEIEVVLPPNEAVQSLEVPQESPTATLFASVWRNTVELYDLQTQKSTKHTISEDFGRGGSYVQTDKDTLYCLGGDPPSCMVFALDLPSLELTKTPPLNTARGGAGVANTVHFMYAFGGSGWSAVLKSCEKYSWQDRRWQPMGNMKEPRYCFTPCSFRSLIYLLCPNNTLRIETFCPETELFAVLPISLPLHMRKDYSVSFVVNGELCFLTGGRELGRWQIESGRDFSLSNTSKGCWSIQPPLIVNSLVLISNNANNGKVELFNLSSYKFA